MKNLFAFLRHGWAAVLLLSLLGACSNADSFSPGGGDNGRGGSMARFTILGNTLYTVDEQSLRVFDLGPTPGQGANGTRTAPTLVSRTSLGIGIETIYPEGNYLFIGTQTGMYIFDATNRLQPRQIGHYQHVVSCDPVVVEGRYAYLTLRAGRACGGGINQLQVIDLQNPSQPRLAQSYPMQEPYGLGVDAGQLFVCDRGLKVFTTAQSPTPSHPGSAGPHCPTGRQNTPAASLADRQYAQRRQRAVGIAVLVQPSAPDNQQLTPVRNHVVGFDGKEVPLGKRGRLGSGKHLQAPVAHE
jgi:hypothetical protein